MNIGDLITIDRVSCDNDAASKKRVLDVLSELLAKNQTQLTALDIFSGLLNRERLGSTGLGHGVAIPHTRLSGSEKAIGAVLKLKQGIVFGAADGEPVDLFFALLVPDHFTDEHLQLLAGLAEMFSDKPFCAMLRVTQDASALCHAIKSWQA